MGKSLIKAVLLDYGGVIADEGFQNGLRALSREQGLDEERMMMVAKHAVYDSGFILGQGSEQDFWAMMRERSGLEGSDAGLTRRILEGFKLRTWMIELVKNCRQQGLRTGILSDQSHWLDTLNERDNFFRYFDPLINSYHVGKGKRDPDLFVEVTEQLALEPDEILFIDDMKSNVERALAAGWQAIHFTDRESCLERVQQLTGVTI